MNTEFAILLVVDDPLNARLIAAELEKSKAPIRIDVVHDGEEALDYLLRQTRRPQLILVDSAWMFLDRTNS